VRCFVSADRLVEAAGEQLGVSAWRRVDQSVIDAFADVTGDHQWIHRAGRQSGSNPFGGPVAHGFLLLAMLPAMIAETFRVDSAELTINRGLDRARFRAPVRAGARVRVTTTLRSARLRPHGFCEAVIHCGAEADTAEPVFDAEVVFLIQCGVTSV
jgi:acyl dehydratase